MLTKLMLEDVNIYLLIQLKNNNKIKHTIC